MKGLKHRMTSKYMHIVTCIVTRNAAISTKTLHSMLNINKLVFTFGFTHEYIYVNDDLSERQSIFLKKIKNCDRLVWIDYSISVDGETLPKLYDKFVQGYNCLVLPCVTPGIDWDLFKKKVLSGSHEPVSQMGLHFDTTVDKCIGENYYTITETNPKCWSIDSKQFVKCIRDKKGETTIPLKVSDMFKKLVERGLKVYTYTNANIFVTYPHECIGNILQSASIHF